jgi:hypothetical protein
MKNYFDEPSLLSLTSQVGVSEGTSGTLGTPSEKSFFLGDSVDSHLNQGILENVRQRGNDVICACPACRTEGNDRKGDNLRIFSTGAYHCIAHPKDRDHNRKIFALVGVRGGKQLDPVAKREWRERRAREFQREGDKAALQAVAKSNRHKIIDRWEWNRADVWDDSPQRIDCELVEYDPRWFLNSLFPQDSIVWTGETTQSGQDGRHANRWKTVAAWQEESIAGPMVTPATWNEGTDSRTASNVATAPYTVLDFDGFDGVKPETPEQLRAHLRGSLAMIHWIYKGLEWDLAAILWTGGKSLHAWFHTPLPEVLRSLRETAEPLGMDAGLIGRPEHPCRLPGHRHEHTQKLSRILWLQSPI